MAKKVVKKKKIEKKKRRIKINPKLLIAAVITIVLIVCFVYKPSDPTAKGVAYVKKQEKLKVEDITETLKSKSKEEKKQAVSDGKLDIFASIDDYVLYGDSRVMGYSVYSYVDDSIVFAGSGYTLSNVDEWNESLKNMLPSIVIMSYGVNDMGLQLNDTYEGGYKQLAIDKMNNILSIVPNAKIYLCGIIPCSPEALEENPDWGNVDTYNSALKSACDAVDACTYVDDAGLADGGNADIYSGDGIHFTSTFYPTWFQTIVDTMDN